MTAEVATLMWRGARTIDAAERALAGRRDVELQLPAGYHHAVSAHFASPGVTVGGYVDEEGAADLLTRFRAVRGLEHIASLEQSVRRAQARVRVVSPSPTVTIRCDRTSP